MSALLIEPHNLGDDAVLFACFTLIRERPHVVTVLRSDAQMHKHGFMVNAEEREAENDAAFALLGCTWEQWPYSDLDPDWATIAGRIAGLAGHYDRIYVPARHKQGNEQHNRIGELSACLLEGRPQAFTEYCTYTNYRDRMPGLPVPYERPWLVTKFRALACYQSQIGLESTHHHFMGPLDEYYAHVAESAA